MSLPRNDPPQLQDAIADAISTATRGAGRVNILVAGKTGVGKSTLINAVFRGELAKTGAGKPVTQSTQEFTKAGHPLTIIDTRGLEVADYDRSRRELADLIRERSASDDQDRHLHVAWLCIQDSSHRVEDAEIELCGMLADAGIPVVAVLTKRARTARSWTRPASCCRAPGRRWRCARCRNGSRNWMRNCPRWAWTS